MQKFTNVQNAKHHNATNHSQVIRKINQNAQT